MEEVGAQLVPPIFIHHQGLGGGGGGGRFFETHHNPATSGKKRSLSYYDGPPVHLQPHQQLQNLNRDWQNWNPKAWDWDSARFVAKPLESPNVLQRKEREEENGGVVPITLQQQKQKNRNRVDGDDDQSLQLQLGGGGGSGSLNSVDETVSKSLKPNKRVRSGSPGGGGGGGGSTYPKCQVDNCKEDLSNAKDYHRRHKVCQLHSKCTQAIVGKQMQRFCQQCSRFHPLSEFDEGKRSCRRRLAGHNRRRRKTQPEDVTSRPLLPTNYDHSDSGNLDIVKLLAILARAQGKINDNNANVSSVPDKDQLIQILNKINSLPLPPDFAAKLCKPGSINKTNPERVSSETQNRLSGDASSPSTMDLLAVLSSTLATSSPDSLSMHSERKSESSDAAEKAKSVCPNENTGLSFLNGHSQAFPSVGGESSTSYQSPLEDSDCQVQETRVKPLELFLSSPEDDSPPKLATTRKYFSSESSGPMDERSPSASPPVVQTLFPMQALRESGKSQNMSISRVCNDSVEYNKSRGCTTSLDLFGGSKRGAGNSTLQGFPHQAGYTSSSGSDHSPPSFNSDAQDCTGRIIFKLFDKDPSHLPGTLRTEIYNWLSHSPSEMESYIRPGCVVLSIYVSMSSAAWELLEENLLQLVNSLVQDSESDFWKSGRFLIHTGRKLASHKDGKIRLCKSWRTWTSPELISVSPLAIVGGQETSLVLRGRNLSTDGAKIYYTHMGGYISKEATVLACQGSEYDEISLDSFKIHGAVSNVLGRCFIEVENGFRGTSFPIIIADAPICKELRLLESELNEYVKEHDTVSRDTVRDFVQRGSRDTIMHFLNELGWLFQRKTIYSPLDDPEYKLSRFKFLFIFSLERDFCALVKTLLDILAERSLGREDLSSESLGMLSEVQLLNRAVKRRCRTMVDLLLRYSVHSTIDTSKIYIFPPNLCGPGGVTPLHFAASTSGSDDMVDALTSDPQEIGLRGWNSLLDANGLSPYAYALMRNNHSYNVLVARKLADRTNSQVSVSIGNEIVEQRSTTVDKEDGSRAHKRSCSKCAVVAARCNRRMPGSRGLLYRPYIHSMLAIAAVCVCVCLLFRGAPNIGLVAPFKWENLECGPS